MRARFFLSTIFTVLSTSISYIIPNFAAVLGYRATWGRPENVKARRSGKILQTAFPEGVPFLIYQNADYNSSFRTYDK